MRNRRDFLRQIACAGFAAIPAVGAKAAGTIGLGLGNYGLKTYSTLDAIRLIHSIGYDSVELTMMDGYTTEATKVAPQERRRIKSLLGELGLALPTLLEQIPILGSAADHKTHVDRIRRNAEFGHDVNAGVGGVVPCVQTHLGGATKDWEKVKGLMVERLRDWAEAGRETKTVVAFKGHNLNLNDTSEKTAWLIEQVNSPWLRVLYDYSHYQAVGEDLGASMRRLLPYTAAVSVKDGRNYKDKPGFERLLPGDGTVDYVDYYKKLIEYGYKGHTVIEISGQIHSRPGYNADATAKRCYAAVAPAMAKAGVHRPAHRKA